MKITILGHVCIDKNTSENSSYTAAGSPAMFMNKIFRQLPDNQLTIIAPYGADFLEYAENGKLYPEKPSGKNTLVYENITKGGARIQKAHHTKEKEIPLPTKAVPESEVVDSVGSGDIFSAGFAHRYQQTHSLEKAGRFANELARQCLFYTPSEIKPRLDN